MTSRGKVAVPDSRFPFADCRHASIRASCGLRFARAAAFTHFAPVAARMPPPVFRRAAAHRLRRAPRACGSRGGGGRRARALHAAAAAIRLF
ncbi:hypothetical protein [Burkholderia pseudomallei]|uniref:hypothetical protein n=1 Tax=Burkholderia pseudomallei TaxID=28450 RepID=UPI0009783B08|nr:hypothetical protein [Burkholderia pseudomallei]OMT65713.1 hypothetical protein AQ761_01445 [Burkholderia pseudomallei]